MAVVLCGCFDSGSAQFASGTVRDGALCTSPPDQGCPACSTRDGALCRGQWYTTDLRCESDAQCGGQGSCRLGHCVTKDDDGDGVDDGLEREVAEMNFPKVMLAKGESCGAPHGVIYRVRRHPQRPERLAITYIVLYDTDCGQLNGHVGDAETFAITVDLDVQPGGPATVGVKAWAHAGTQCGSTSSCEAAPGTAACAEPGSTSLPPEVVIWASSDKHANYLSTSTCGDNCFDSCSAGERLTGPLLNVGEPDHPLVHDLTDQGFVTAANGWNAQLLHFDPWGSAEFSGGGRTDTPLAEQLAPSGP
jgi:hypothetical protein